MTKSIKPMIRIHNVSTNEIVDREMNVAEYSNYQATIKMLDDEKIETETKIAQRQLILDKLGLTADEAKLLIG